MSISQHQKQSILGALGNYLTGNDNVKRVMNSPCLDRNGAKMLSYDGTKVLDSNRFGRGNRRNSKRGRDNNRNDQSNDKGSGKKKKNKSQKRSENVSSLSGP